MSTTPNTDHGLIPRNVDARWMLLLVGLALGGGVGSGVTAATSPDLELAKRDAVEVAVKRAAEERARDLLTLERQLLALEQQLATVKGQLIKLDDRLDDIEGSQARIETRLEELLNRSGRR